MTRPGLLRDFGRGAAAVGEGLRLLFRPGFRRFTLVPLALNGALFTAAVWLLVRWLEPWVDRLAGRFGGWLGPLAWLCFAVAVVFVVVQVFVIVGTWVAAPFHAFLSLAVERRRGPAGTEAPFSFAGLAGEAGFALVQELRKAVYFLALALPVLALGFVPVLQLLAPPLWVVVGSWILAVESFDFPWSARRVPLRAQLALLRARPGLAFGVGLAAFGLGLVPLVQLVAVPAAVAGATLVWLRAWGPTGAEIGPPRAPAPPANGRADPPRPPATPK